MAAPPAELLFALMTVLFPLLLLELKYISPALIAPLIPAVSTYIGKYSTGDITDDSTDSTVAGGILSCVMLRGTGARPSNLGAENVLRMST